MKRINLIALIAVSAILIHMPAAAAEPPINDRYAEITISDEEMDELAALVWLEAGNQTAEAQQAVAEVVLNRAVNEWFPDTIHEVLHQDEGADVPQFHRPGKLDTVDPGQAQYDAIHAALYDVSILPVEVVYFSLQGENDRVWGQIDDIVFCYEYVWE